MEAVGIKKDSLGCEICKPAIGSILSSLWNEHVMNPVHHSYVTQFFYVCLRFDTVFRNQDTNDRFVVVRFVPENS